MSTKPTTPPGRSKSAATASRSAGSAPARAAAPRSRTRDDARALFRDGILAAAEQVFADRGFHAARIQDIAETARIAVGTLYNHFDTKEDVLRALLDERTEQMATRLAPAPGDAGDFADKLTLRVQRMLEFAEGHRNFFVVASECGLVTAAPTRDMRVLVGKSIKNFERFKAAFRAVVQEGIDQGALVPEDPRVLAAVLGGTIRALSFTAMVDGETGLGRFAPMITRLFLHGAAAPREPRAPVAASNRRSKAGARK